MTQCLHTSGQLKPIKLPCELINAHVGGCDLSYASVIGAMSDREALDQ